MKCKGGRRNIKESGWVEANWDLTSLGEPTLVVLVRSNFKTSFVLVVLMCFHVSTSLNDEHTLALKRFASTNGGRRVWLGVALFFWIMDLIDLKGSLHLQS